MLFFLGFLCGAAAATITMAFLASAAAKKGTTGDLHADRNQPVGPQDRVGDAD